MRLASIVVVMLGVVVLAACSGSSSMMTEPSPMPGPGQGTGMGQGASISVMNAAVLVNGVPVQGNVSRGTGDRTLFRVHVTATQGLSDVGRVVMQYNQPGSNHHGGHGGPVTGGYNGTVDCYDDGTHGDDMPGDGIYHYIDPEDQIGCHGVNAPGGEYRYSFWAEGTSGQRSNTAIVTIVRE